MGAIRYELRAESSDAGLIEKLAAVHPRIGVEGVLRRRGTRAWPGRVPAAATVEGFRWGPRDGWSTRWWPQGLEVLSEHDDSILVASWFAQKRRGVSQGARITVIDRRDRRRPRYHHVLLVEAVRGFAGGSTCSRCTCTPVASRGSAICSMWPRRSEGFARSICGTSCG